MRTHRIYHSPCNFQTYHIAVLTTSIMLDITSSVPAYLITGSLYLWPPSIPPRCHYSYPHPHKQVQNRLCHSIPLSLGFRGHPVPFTHLHEQPGPIWLIVRKWLGRRGQWLSSPIPTLPAIPLLSLLNTVPFSLLCKTWLLLIKLMPPSPSVFLEIISNSPGFLQHLQWWGIFIF